ncbi:MAG TPA: hypothetical protein VMR06_08725 [Dokdonella sp.]|uniref:hypothetical protein n=1 Tax=Dokdonella sp. TaxID=2291710 RepID=UPI002BCF0401|nr:hypothetical protein [Dokdonella sp.]HUD42065.1 hypothetical protein [Dokdonella sp.]
MEPLRVLLLVADAPLVRALKALLRMHEVIVAADGDDALASARERDVDVIVASGRLAGGDAVAMLAALRTAQPRAQRIALFERETFAAVAAAVNEAEVWHVATVPWPSNDVLAAVVAEAGTIARSVPVLLPDAALAQEQAWARAQVGVLVIEDDPTLQQRLRDQLQARHQVRFASSAERAIQVVEQYETGVVFAEVDARHGDLGGWLQALKAHQPQILAVAACTRQDPARAIALANEARVFRLLARPLDLRQCEQAIAAALERYMLIKRSPDALPRHALAAVAAAEPLLALPSASQLARIRALPARVARQAAGR